MTSCKDILVSAAHHTPAAMPTALRADSEGPSRGLHTLLLHHLLSSLSFPTPTPSKARSSCYSKEFLHPAACLPFTASNRRQAPAGRDECSKREHLLQLCPTPSSQQGQDAASPSCCSHTPVETPRAPLQPSPARLLRQPSPRDPS